MIEKRNTVNWIINSFLWIAAISMTLLLIGQVLYFPYLFHDVALYVSLGQKIAHGAIPYVNAVDTNPPMIIYISTIPALFSKWLGTPLAMTALVFFLGLVFVLGLSFLFALKLTNPQISRNNLIVVWVFWVWMALWIYKLGIFAEREHFIYLFLAGFIVIRYGRYAGVKIHPGWAAAYGVLAAIGIGMKPHYLIPWLGAEIVFMGIYKWNLIPKSVKSLQELKNLLLRVFENWKTPEIISLALSGIFYLGHFFLIPGMSNYYTYWIPLFARGYKVLDTGWSSFFNLQLLTSLLEFIPVVFLAIGIAILYRQKINFTFSPLLLAFAIFSLLSFFVYVIQKKGWFYQSIGFHLGLITIVGLVIGNFFQDSLNKKESTIAATGLIFCLVLANFSITNSTLNKFFTEREEILQIQPGPFVTLIDRLSLPGESVMFISTGIGDPFPALTYSGRTNASRFGMAIPLAIILSNADPKAIAPEWKADEKIYYSGLLDDIQKNNPRIVLVSNGKETVENITVINYLRKKSFFENNLSAYACVGKIDNFSVYLRLPSKDNAEYNNFRDNIFYLYSQKILGNYSKECALTKE